MVLGALGDLRDPAHEVNRHIEVGKLEGPLDLTAAEPPPGSPLKPIPNLRLREFRNHGVTISDAAANPYTWLIVSIPQEHQSLRTMRPHIGVISLEPTDVHGQIARILSDRFELDAQLVSEDDSVATAMAVREMQAVVVVGRPTAKEMQGCVLQEAVASMIPVIALWSGASFDSPLPIGVSVAMDPDLGPDHLATAIHALVARQREVQRLQNETASAIRFSGGLRSEIDTIQGELQLAASVQREFLPRALPTLAGVTSDALWRPAAYVSGDIYSVTRLDEFHLGFFVTDAVGHGVPAALLTLVISRSLPTKEIQGNSYRILPPREALARVNADMMTRVGRTTRFATAIYAVLDTRTFEMTVASAGHPPMLRIPAGGVCEAIQTEGGLLGVFEDEQFEETTIHVEKGDKLLFYTDGFEQAFPELGHDPAAPRIPNRRYIDVFNELSARGDPGEFIAEVGKRLDEESDQFPQVDDLTLLCAWRGE